jgi:hypothetical protein
MGWSCLLGLQSAQACLDDPVAAIADCEQVLANVHHVLGRNYQQLAYVSGLPRVTCGQTHAFHHWLAALDARPFLFPGLVAGGAIAAPEPGDIAAPHGRPIPIWGYWGAPAMPRSTSTPLEGRYTDNDSWSTNELDIDWQGVTLYNLYLARWWAARAQRRAPACRPRQIPRRREQLASMGPTVGWSALFAARLIAQSVDPIASIAHVVDAVEMENIARKGSQASEDPRIAANTTGVLAEASIADVSAEGGGQQELADEIRDLAGRLSMAGCGLTSVGSTGDPNDGADVINLDAEVVGQSHAHHSGSRAGLKFMKAANDR